MSYVNSMFQIALVKWTESVGICLIERDLTTMTISGPSGQTMNYDVLQLFPFTSERKRMGIILRVCRWLCFSMIVSHAVTSILTCTTACVQHRKCDYWSVVLNL